MHIKVQVRADAKNENVREMSRGKFEIAVREPAAQNRANERAMALMAQHLGLPVAKLRIITGHHRPSKLVLISEA